MIKKCKVSDLARDLNITSKELIALFDEHLQDHKKASAVLSEEEINIALEIYSQKNQVESFDSYFASASQKQQAVKSEPVNSKKKDSGKPEKTEQSKKSEKQLNLTDSKKSDSRQNNSKTQKQGKKLASAKNSEKSQEFSKAKKGEASKKKDPKVPRKKENQPKLLSLDQAIASQRQMLFVKKTTSAISIQNLFRLTSTNIMNAMKIWQTKTARTKSKTDFPKSKSLNSVQTKKISGLLKKKQKRKSCSVWRWSALGIKNSKSKSRMKLLFQILRQGLRLMFRKLSKS